MDKEDIILIEKAKQNTKSFELLYKKYAQRLFNYFWYRVGHKKDVAEDLLQETFMKAYQNLPRFYLRSYSYYSYLLTIAHNILVNYYRKNKYQLISLESIGNVPDEITVDQEIDKKQAAELLWRDIQKLSQTEKDILLLRYQKELSIKDIARIVKKSDNAVKLILSRSRKKLAKHKHLEDIAGFGEFQKKYTKPRFLSEKNDTIT